MLKYIINGGQNLEGEVRISGSKNAALPIIAASILNQGKTTLCNVPDIEDINISIDILKYLGCKIKKDKNKIEIDSSNMEKFVIPENLMKKMRSSIIIAGAVLGKYGKVIFSQPGGCKIGARPIDLHLKSFKKLGINIEEYSGFIKCFCDRIIGGKVELKFPSVGATENIILTTVLSEGETTIINAAREPEIVDLVKMLRKMGAEIYGEGTNIIKICGVKKLGEISYKIMPDRIECGTFLCLGAILGKEIKINKIFPEHIISVISKLEEMGCKLIINNDSIVIKQADKLKAVDIITAPYPGFPTDMQPIMTSILIFANGISKIRENVFENRFNYSEELKKMGANIIRKNNNELVIKEIYNLHNADMEITDLRGGAAMVISALKVKGISEIINIEHVLRGYEDFEKKLKKLGAKIDIKKGE